jgi:hypothetical protein
LQFKLFLTIYYSVATSSKSTEMYVIDVMEKDSFPKAWFRAILLNKDDGVRRHALTEGFLDLVASGVARNKARAPIGDRRRSDANLGALTLPAHLYVPL